MSEIEPRCVCGDPESSLLGKYRCANDANGKDGLCSHCRRYCSQSGGTA